MVITTILNFEKIAFQQNSIEGTQQNKKDKMVLKKAPPMLYLQNPVFGIKIFTNN